MLQLMNATDVRKKWSSVVDATVRVKPQFFKRTRDYVFLSDFHFMEDLLAGYSYSATQMAEEDGSITLALNEIDLVENGKDEKDARKKLASAILEYAEDYYRKKPFRKPMNFIRGMNESKKTIISIDKTLNENFKRFKNLVQKNFF